MPYDTCVNCGRPRREHGGDGFSEICPMHASKGTYYLSPTEAAWKTARATLGAVEARLKEAEAILRKLALVKIDGPEDVTEVVEAARKWLTKGAKQ